MKRIGLALALVTPFMLGAQSALAEQSIAVVVKAARMLNVNDGKWVSPAVVVIRNDKIVAAGSNVAVPSGAKVIDLGNKSLLPGLIDMHTHLTGDPENAGYSVVALSMPRVALIGAKNARLTVEAGFTAVRDVGAEGYTDIALRDAIDAGDVVGPRMLASGPALGITGGHCDDTMHAPESSLSCGFCSKPSAW